MHRYFLEGNSDSPQEMTYKGNIIGKSSESSSGFMKPIHGSGYMGNSIIPVYPVFFKILGFQIAPHLRKILALPGVYILAPPISQGFHCFNTFFFSNYHPSQQGAANATASSRGVTNRPPLWWLPRHPGQKSPFWKSSTVFDIDTLILWL